MPPVLFGAVLFLSKVIGMLTEVPSPTWCPIPVPMPKPMDIPGVPAVQAQSMEERRMRGIEGFMAFPRYEYEPDCRR